MPTILDFIVEHKLDNNINNINGYHPEYNYYILDNFSNSLVLTIDILTNQFTLININTNEYLNNKFQFISFDHFKKYCLENNFEIYIYPKTVTPKNAILELKQPLIIDEKIIPFLLKEPISFVIWDNHNYLNGKFYTIYWEDKRYYIDIIGFAVALRKRDLDISIFQKKIVNDICHVLSSILQDIPKNRILPVDYITDVLYIE